MQRPRASVRRTGKDFEIQGHAATLYANGARLESRVLGPNFGATCSRTSPLVAIFRMDEDGQKHASSTQPITSSESRPGTLHPWA